MKNKIREIYLLPSVVTLLVCSVFSCYAASGVLPDIRYQPAEKVDIPSPSYPYSQSKKRHAGRVEIEFIINREGTVEMPVVVSSTHQAFERAALESVKDYQFKPAMLNGKSVPSAKTWVVIFMMKRQKAGVTPEFKSNYRRLNELLDSDEVDREKVDRLLSRLKNRHVLNTNSQALIGAIEYQRAVKFGSQQAQYRALKKLMMFESVSGEQGKFLSAEQEETILIQLIQLQFTQQRFAEALTGYKELKKSFPARATELAETIEKVEKYIESGQPYSQEVLLDERGNYFAVLGSDKFFVDDVRGDLSEFIFRCDANAKKMPVSIRNDYQIPKSWGRCLLQISGTPGASAKLVQHSLPSEAS